MLYKMLVMTMLVIILGAVLRRPRMLVLVPIKVRERQPQAPAPVRRPSPFAHRRP